MDPIHLLGIDDLAALLRCTRKGIYARRHRGELPPASCRRPLGWHPEIVDRWLREQAQRDAEGMAERRR